MKITIELQAKYQELIDKGYSTRQIADSLQMPWSTVKSQFRKLGLKTVHHVTPTAPINKELLEQLIARKMSQIKMAKELGCSQARIKYWLRKYNLQSNSGINSIYENEKKVLVKFCSKCQTEKPLTSEYFYLTNSNKFHCWCKKCNNSITMDRIRNRKKDLVNYKGGKCVICGYSKCDGALDFHHLDPSKKEFNIGYLKTYNFTLLKEEADKCILLCKNCHAEVHAGLVILPVN